MTRPERAPSSHEHHGRPRTSSRAKIWGVKAPRAGCSQHWSLCLGPRPTSASEICLTTPAGPLAARTGTPEIFRSSSLVRSLASIEFIHLLDGVPS
jgi:hypothetical protein